MGLSMGFVVKVTPSNNNPSILGNFLLDCVSELQGCPKLLRTDPGTENVVMATMQCLLRENGIVNLLERRLTDMVPRRESKS